MVFLEPWASREDIEGVRVLAEMPPPRRRLPEIDFGWPVGQFQRTRNFVSDAKATT